MNIWVRLMTADRVKHRLVVFVMFSLVVGMIYVGIGRACLNVEHASSTSGCSVRLPIDDQLPFLPWSIIFYLSLWLLWFVPIWKLPVYEFASFLTAMVITYSASFGLFALCCDFHIRQPLDRLSPTMHTVYDFLYAVDPPSNTFPSLHASVTMIILIYLSAKKGSILCYVWGGLILLSSIFTKQHAILDVIAGILIGFAATFVARNLTQSPST